MRYLLTIAILLIATSASSVNLKTYTVCESGCDYTSVQAAETAHQQDLVTNDSAITFEIQNTWASPYGGTVVDGSTTDATRFFTITAVGAARATATWSTTAYRAIVAASIIFNANEEQERAKAIVLATTFWNESDKVKEAQKMIDERQSMLGLDVNTLELRMQDRGASS